MSAVLAVVAGLGEGFLDPESNASSIILSALAAIGLVTLVSFTVSLLLAPARLHVELREQKAQAEARLGERIAGVEGERDAAQREVAALQEMPEY